MSQIKLHLYNQSSWNEIFKNKTLKARIIKLNYKFLQYLLEDGVFIDQKYQNLQDGSSFSSDGNEQIEQQNSDSSEKDGDLQGKWVFPEFDEKIQKVLEQFNKEVFVKLNWNAPTDSEGWIPQLKCSTIEDIFIILQSSAIVSQMLTNIFEDVQSEEDLEQRGGLYLIIRQWQSLNCSMEFRVFVKDKQIYGICQRNLGHCYNFLKEKSFQDLVIQKIEVFFEFVQKNFEESQFIFDVYIDIPPNRRVWLVDINPWHDLTNLLLFQDHDFSQKHESIVFKCILNQQETVINNNNQFKVPIEFTGEYSEENIQVFQTMIQQKVSDQSKNN